MQRATPDHRLTRIDAGCSDLDEDLTGSRNRAGHGAHLEDVNAAVRIELHCFRHEACSNPASLPKTQSRGRRRRGTHGERGAIHRKTDAVEPFVHLDGILAHALADDIERNLVIAKRAPRDARENGHGVIPVELVSREVEALAREATGVFEDANGDRPNVRDGNLRELSCRRECRRVDSFRELLFYEIEVLHEGNGRENRCADADFGDVLFDLVLAVEATRGRREGRSSTDVACDRRIQKEERQHRCWQTSPIACAAIFFLSATWRQPRFVSGAERSAIAICWCGKWSR